MNGKLFIVSAPSGTGKTTLLKKVMQEVSGLTFSISHTTRAPRQGERHGQDYFFVDTDCFEAMIADGGFIEYARVHENYYGTALAPLQQQLRQGRDIILDIDVQGAAIIRAKNALPAVHIFIAPPSLGELERRLRGRGSENEATVLTRLKNAREEMLECDKYDYLVVNENIPEALAMLTGIIYAERSRGRRTRQGEPAVVRLDI